jgi:hypothetical protein
MSKTITKAGVHAEVIDKEGNVPITVFVARDHHYTDRQFSELKENTKILKIFRFCSDYVLMTVIISKLFIPICSNAAFSTL